MDNWISSSRSIISGRSGHSAILGTAKARVDADLLRADPACAVWLQIRSAIGIEIMYTSTARQVPD